MTDAMLWALPAIALVFAVTTAALRRAPSGRYRRLLVVNGQLDRMGGARQLPFTVVAATRPEL